MGTEMESSGNRTALGVSADIAQEVGARLRKARESIGRSTSALSAKIKVREHYLVAIEDGDWNELPPGLNGRGLVRIYARELSVSVPELDQAANQTVMPAEQVAQAPYQISGSKKDQQSASHDRDIPVVRVNHVDPTEFQSSGVRIPETGKTNTLHSPSRTSRPATEASARAGGASSSGYKLLETTPEEAPLDVITPDVASILGISLDTIEEVQKPASLSVINSEPARPAKTSAPKTPEKSGKSKKQSRHAAGAYDAETVVVLPEDSAAAAKTATSEIQPVLQNMPQSSAASAVVAPADVVAVATETAAASADAPAVETATVADSAKVSSQIAPVLPELSVSEGSLNAETGSSDTTGVSAAEAYLKAHELSEAPSDEVASEQNKGLRSKAMTYGLLALAACVVVLIAGRLMTSAPPAEDIKPAESALVEPAAKSETQSTVVEVEPSAAAAGDAPTQPAAGVQKPANQEPAASTGAPASVPALNSAVPAAAKASPVSAPAAEKTAAGAPAAVAPVQPSPEMAVSAEEAEAIEAPTPAPVNKTVASGSKAAVLTLLEPIEIQVVSDGQRVFSGRKEAGKVNIKFNKRAEIFVQDGSKAQLSYAGWNHGALGQVGRKRRIVLNAEPFAAE